MVGARDDLQAARATSGSQLAVCAKLRARVSGHAQTLAGVQKALRKLVRKRSGGGAAQLARVLAQVGELSFELRRLSHDFATMEKTSAACHTFIDRAIARVPPTPRSRRRGAHVLHNSNAREAGLATAHSVFIVSEHCVPFPSP